MALDDDIAILAAAPVFGFLDRDALRLLTFAGERRELAEGEVLFRRGERSDGGFVVMSGRIALTPRGEGAEPVVAERSALIGRNALFLPGKRPADAVAAEPSEVMRISPNLMSRVLREFPDAAESIRDAIADDLADLIDGLNRVRDKLAPTT